MSSRRRDGAKRTRQKPAEPWDDAADAWTEFVRGGHDYYREYLNTPATLRLIGKVRGLRVLDLGCGEGYHARILARRGAHVTAVDLSPRLIGHAQAEERRKPLGIRYLVRDAADLAHVRAGSFDLVASFMVLTGVRDWKGAVREAARVLRPGGRFVSSIPHPCFDVVWTGKRLVSGWVREGDAPGGRPLYFRVDDYFRTGWFPVPWVLRGTGYRMRARGWHVTLQDCFEAFARNGLQVRRVVEPRPSAEGVRAVPGLAKVNRVPQSIVLDCVKVARSRSA